MNLLTSIRRHLPQRRRRSWRYVSGRRHRVGMALFALLILLTYGWWYFTNAQRVERYAERYLHRLTGAEVRIDKAEFSLSQGIKLSRVRAFYRDGGRREDLFEAREVYLRQESLSLLTGSPRVSEVTCVEPVLMLLQERDSNQWRTQGFFDRREPSGGAGYAGKELPVLRFRGARLRFGTAGKGEPLPIGITPALNILATPDPGTSIYTFTVEQVGSQSATSIQGQGFYNIVTHEMSINGWLPLDGLDTTLPQRYRQWYERHKLSGELSVSFEKKNSAAPQRLVARLTNVSMELPTEEGGLQLTGLAGQISFSRTGVVIEHLEGQLPQPGGTVAVEGRYDGYAISSPFDIQITCGRIELPLSLEEGGTFFKPLIAIQSELNPRGAVALSARIVRGEDGVVKLSGRTKLQKVSLSPATFPYELQGVEGEIEFRDNVLTLRDISARHGSAQITASGDIADISTRPVVNVTAGVRDLAFDHDLFSALPQWGQNVWNGFMPEGFCNLKITAKPDSDGKPQTTVFLEFDGRAAVTYSEFPYRGDKLVGSLVIDADGVRIDGVTGRHKDGSITVSGLEKHDAVGWHTDVRLSATNIAMDDDLAAALPANARDTYDSFHVSGAADIAGRFTRPPGGPTDYDLSATLRQASLTYDGFKFPLTNTNGVLRFTPQRTYVDHLAGRHEKAQIVVDGQVWLDRSPAGVDLSFTATDLALDKELYAALPPAVTEVWDEIAPSGLADLVFKLRPDEAPQGGRDYELALHATNMTLRYAKFPYTVRNLKGLITAVPGKVELVDLSAGDGDTAIAASGTITADAGGSHAALKISTRNLPVDESLVQAIPAQLKTLLGDIAIGGQCDMDLRNVNYRATPTMASPRWVVDGRLGLKDVALMGAQNVTGDIDGHMECNSRGDFGAIRAEINLAEATLEERRLTRISGTAIKAAGNPLLRIDDFAADAYGGRMAGFAEFSLAYPSQYGLNLTVEKIKIDDLLNAGHPGTKIEGMGELAGTLQMMGTVGQPDSRQAGGEMHFHNAQTYKLPVMWGLLNVALLQLPGESAFREGSLTYHMKGNLLNMQQVYLSGRTTSLLGSGTVRLPDEQIHLTFISGPSKLIPPLLSQLMQITSKGLFQLHVSGTLRHPFVETRPLGDMNDLLREMVTAR